MEKLIQSDNRNFYLHPRIMPILGDAIGVMIALQEQEPDKDGFFVYSWNDYFKRFNNCTKKEYKKSIKTLEKFKILETESRQGQTYHRFLDENEAMRLIDKALERKSEDLKQRLGEIPEYWQRILQTPWDIE